MARSKSSKTNVNKLPRLPKNARILKRPLFHPAIPSAHAGPSQQKVIYISTSTPFMSAATRVRKMLEIIEKRYHTNSLLGQKNSTTTAATITGDNNRKKKKKEGVVLKGTSRAIEKTLGLALFFQGKQGYEVRIRTGTVSVVDDVVEREGKEWKDGGGSMQGVPETRVRRLGCVEAEIKMV